MTYRRRLSVVAAALLTSLFVVATNAAAGDTGEMPSLSGENVIHYTSDDSLSDVTRFIVEGKQNSGGCSFETSVVIPTEARSTGEKWVFNEIAYDPTRCMSLIERGTSTKDNTTDIANGGHVRAGGSSTGSEQQQSGQATQAEAPPCTSFSGWCWYIGFHSWFEDPIDIHVNDVTNDISWPQDSTTCALPAGTSFGWGYLYQWFTTTGWSLEDSNVTHPGDCNSVRSSSYAYFLNTVFCPDNNWTHVWYDRNTIIGYPGGTAQGEIGWNKNGACNGLLSYNWEYTFS